MKTVDFKSVPLLDHNEKNTVFPARFDAKVYICISIQFFEKMHNFFKIQQQQQSSCVE